MLYLKRKTHAPILTAICSSLVLISSPAFAKKAISSQSRKGLEAVCAANGGSYRANLNSYHCVLTCTSSDGKHMRTCAINCDANGNCSIVGNYEAPKRSIGLKDLISGGNLNKNN